MGRKVCTVSTTKAQEMEKNWSNYNIWTKHITTRKIDRFCHSVYYIRTLGVAAHVFWTHEIRAKLIQYHVIKELKKKMMRNTIELLELLIGTPPIILLCYYIIEYFQLIWELWLRIGPLRGWLCYIWIKSHKFRLARKAIFSSYVIA